MPRNQIILDPQQLTEGAEGARASGLVEVGAEDDVVDDVRLNRAPETINLGDAIAALEPHFHLVECFAPNGQCPIRPACRLKDMLAEAQQVFLDVLRRYHLNDVLTQPSTLLHLLGSS